MNNKYSFAKYNYIERWVSYWHQIDEIAKLNPIEVLEIGPGNNFVTNYLRNLEINVKTLDIKEENKPDVVGSVLALPFADNSFDTVLCAEVLEHLPFENFSNALAELKRVARKSIVLSLPHWGWLFYLKIKLPLLGEKKIYFKFSGIAEHKLGEHCWEIGKKGFAAKKIKNMIIETDLKIKKEFLDPDSPYHHFFILEKV